MTNDQRETFLTFLEQIYAQYRKNISFTAEYLNVYPEHIEEARKAIQCALDDRNEKIRAAAKVIFDIDLSTFSVKAMCGLVHDQGYSRHDFKDLLTTISNVLYCKAVQKQAEDQEKEAQNHNQETIREDA